MAKETTTKGRLGSLQRLLARLNANHEELAHLDVSRARLDTLLTQVQDATDRQATHMAIKQEASQQIKTLLTEGERLGTVLQLSIKQHYGIRSEKLADFGIKPFRGRARKVDPASKPPAPKQTPPAVTEGDAS